MVYELNTTYIEEEYKHSITLKSLSLVARMYFLFNVSNIIYEKLKFLLEETEGSFTFRRIMQNFYQRFTGSRRVGEVVLI